MRFGYTILYVAEVPASVRFLEAAFGLGCRFVHESQQYAEMETGGTALALASHALAGANLPGGYQASAAHAPPLGFEVGLVTEDVPAAVARAVDAGATLVAAPATKPWGQVVAYVRTPDGFLIELCTPVAI